MWDVADGLLCDCDGDKCEAPTPTDLSRMVNLSIPDDLFTQFNANRWWHECDGDVQEIRRFLRKYFEVRDFFKTDCFQVDENFYAQTALSCLSVSTRPMVRNKVDNTLVIVVKPKLVALRALPQCLSGSEFVHFCMAFAEYCYAQVLQQEKDTSRQSGITVLINFFDMEVQHLLNEFLPFVRMLKTALAQLDEFYASIIVNIFAVNLCGTATTFNVLTRNQLNARTREKIKIVESFKADGLLHRKVSRNAIPISMGGDWIEKDATNYDPFDCVTVGCAQPTKKTTAIQPKRMKMIVLLPGCLCSVNVKAEANSKLSWTIHSNGRFSFRIFMRHRDSDERTVHPRLVICTPLEKKTSRTERNSGRRRRRLLDGIRQSVEEVYHRQR